jgi:hypothetical protein
MKKSNLYYKKLKFFPNYINAQQDLNNFKNIKKEIYEKKN